MKRWIRRFVALIGLFVLLFFLLHTAPGKELSRSVLVYVVSGLSDSDASLGHLDYRLWRGEITLSELTLRSESFDLEVAKVDLHVSLTLQISGDIREPRLAFRFVPDDDESEPWTGIPMNIRHLNLTDGHVRLEYEAEGAFLEVGKIEVALDEEEGGFHSVLKSGAGRLVVDDKELPLEPLEATLEWKGSEILLEQTRVRTGSSEVRVDGTVSPSPLAVDLELDFDLDAGLLDLWEQDWQITGRVDGSGRLEMGDDRLRFGGDFRSEQFEFEEIGAWTIEGKLALEDDVLELAPISLVGYGGTAELEARIELRDGGRNDFRLRFNDVDPTRLTSRLLSLELPWSTRIQGEANLSLTDWGLETAEGRGSIRLSPQTEAKQMSARGEVLFSLASGTLQFDSKKLATSNPRADLSLTGKVRLEGALNVDYRIELPDISEVGLLAGSFDIPESLPIELGGPLSVVGQLTGTFPNVHWTALVESDALVLNERTAELSGDLSGTTKEIVVEKFELQGDDGSISVQGNLGFGEAAERYDLVVDFDGIPLPARLPLRAIAAGRAQVLGTSTGPDWNVEVALRDLTFTGAHKGTADFRVVKKGQRIEVENAKASLADASFEAVGTYSLDSGSIDGRLQLTGLALEELAPVTGLEELGGQVSLNAVAKGPLVDPVGEATVNLSALSLNDKAIPSLELQLKSQNGQVEILGRRDDGTRFLDGTAELEPPIPVHLEFDLAALPLVELMKGLLSFAREDATASAEGTVELDFPLFEPEELRFKANVDSYAANYRGIGHQTSGFQIEGDLSEVRIQNLNILAAEQEVSIDGTVPLNLEGDIDLDVSGSFRLELLAPFVPDLDVRGTANAELKVMGKLGDPFLVGEFRIEDTRGHYKTAAWEDFELTLESHEGRTPSLFAQGKLMGGTVVLKGSLPRALVETAQSGRLELTVEDVDLAQLTPINWEINPTLMLTAHGTFEIPDWSMEGLSASGEIVRLDGRLDEMGVGLSQSAGWTLKDGTFSMPELHMVGDRTDFRLRLPRLEFREPLSFEASLRGNVENTAFNPFLASLMPGMTISGPSTLDFHVSYGSEGLAIGGEGSLSDGRFMIPDPPVVLRDLEARLTFDEGTLTLSDLSARSGGGRIHGEGTIDLKDVNNPRIDLQASAENVRLQLMEGVRGQFSGAVRFQGQESFFRLSGDLQASQGLVTRSLTGDFDDSARRLNSVQAPSVDQGPRRIINLNLSLTTPEDVRFDTDKARLEAGATLKLTGTATSPELSGVISLRPDGSMMVGRNSFQVISARADFDGFPRSSPTLQASMITKVGQTVIELQIDGEPNDLNIRLRAPEDSSLTEGDLMSLLVTGRTLADAGEGGQMMASTWAMSSFANLIHDGLGDIFSFGTPAAAGPLVLAEERNPTSRMTLGFPLTERFSITYSLPLDDPENQLWILDYRVARDVWLRATQESGTDYTLGFTHRFRIGRKQVLEDESEGTVEVPSRNVGRITFGGDFSVPEDELRKRLKIRSGARYDYWKAQDDADALRENLIEKGFLSAVVEVETEQAEGRVDLLFSVEAGRPTELVWEGDDPGSDIKKRTRVAWDGRIPESYLVTDLAARARWRLRSQRYFQAEVEGRVEAGDDRHRIVFDVSKGPRGRAVVLSFEGNESLPDEELRDALPSTTSPTFFSLIDAKQSELETGLRLRYASDGYLYATVGEPRTSFDSETGELRVNIPVDEGPLVRVSNIRFEGATSLSEDQLREALGQKEGDPINFSEFNEGETNIRTLYRNEGFPDVRLRSEISPVPDGIDVTINITEGAPVRIGQIRLVGNLKTQRWVINRELTFKEGEPLRTSKFQESRSNLYDLGIFRTADVRVAPSEPGTETRDVIVQVVERELLDMSYGLRYNFVSQTEESGDVDPESQSRGLEGILRATFPNPLGRSETLSMTAIISQDRPLYRASYLTPRFFKFSIDEERGKNTLGARAQQWSVNFQQTRKLPRGRLNIQWNYSVGEFALLGFRSGAIEIEDEGEFRSRLGGSIFEDERDSVANPTRGRFWNVTLQAGPKWLGSDVDFYRFYSQIFYFYPLGRKLVWASSYRLGLTARGESDVLFVIDDRFKAGGPNSVRGFEHNSLGPKIEFPNGDVAFVGGQAVVIMNQELRFPIYKILHGGVYLDAGEVYRKVKDIRLGDLRWSAGAGLRIVLPFGPLRFDWAEVLNPRENDKLTRFHFSFGYAF